MQYTKITVIALLANANNTHHPRHMLNQDRIRLVVRMVEAMYMNMLPSFIANKWGLELAEHLKLPKVRSVSSNGVTVGGCV